MSDALSRSAPIRGWRDDPAWPDVDVVVPILNEAAHLRDALDAIGRQHYPGSIRTFLAVGPSIDGTEAVAAELASADSSITVVDNPSGKTPAALNRAIRSGAAPVVVRVDGHSNLSDGYITRAVETLRRTGAGNVGGMQVPDPTTAFEASVATATTSWLGTGGAAYRTGGVEAPVDTVYLGVFDRVAIETVGLYDETLIRNQDYELNVRLRGAGYIVIFDPELTVKYRPRGSWRKLATQYYEYGTWKAVVIRRHPRSTKARQLVPTAVFLANVFGFVVGIFRPLALTIPLGYLASLTAASRRLTRKRRPALVVVLATMHLSWGLGFVVSALQLAFGLRPSSE